MMKIIYKLHFFILLLFLSQTVSAQNKILFTYDDSGNRIQRSAEVQEPAPEAAMFLENDTVVTEFADSSTISIYKDNVDETINVKLANKRENTSMVCGYILYDSGGRIIKKSQSGSSEFRIEVSSLSQGIYVLHINCKNATISRKIRLH